MADSDSSVITQDVHPRRRTVRASSGLSKSRGPDSTAITIPEETEPAVVVAQPAKKNSMLLVVTIMMSVIAGGLLVMLVFMKAADMRKKKLQDEKKSGDDKEKDDEEDGSPEDQDVEKGTRSKPKSSKPDKGGDKSKRQSGAGDKESKEPKEQKETRRRPDSVSDSPSPILSESQKSQFQQQQTQPQSQSKSQMMSSRVTQTRIFAKEPIPEKLKMQMVGKDPVSSFDQETIDNSRMMFFYKNQSDANLLDQMSIKELGVLKINAYSKGVLEEVDYLPALFYFSAGQGHTVYGDDIATVVGSLSKEIQQSPEYQQSTQQQSFSQQQSHPQSQQNTDFSDEINDNSFVPAKTTSRIQKVADSPFEIPKRRSSAFQPNAGPTATQQSNSRTQSAQPTSNPSSVPFQVKKRPTLDDDDDFGIPS